MTLNWERYGAEAIGNNPMVPSYWCTLGKDAKGNTWICETRQNLKTGRWRVYFDTDETTESDSPFLRKEVLTAGDYWKACRERYHMKECPYIEIQEHAKWFMAEKGIK